MQVVYDRCCGFGVQKKTVVAAGLLTQSNRSVQRQVRPFSTRTAELLVLEDWLRSQQVRVVAMESPGVFWHPVYNLLEEGRTILLVNSHHMKAVQGHKTEVKDAEWLADLALVWLAHSQLHSASGALSSSDTQSHFPPRGQRSNTLSPWRFSENRKGGL